MPRGVMIAVQAVEKSAPHRLPIMAGRCNAEKASGWPAGAPAKSGKAFPGFGKAPDNPAEALGDIGEWPACTVEGVIQCV